MNHSIDAFKRLKRRLVSCGIPSDYVGNARRAAEALRSRINLARDALLAGD